MEPFAGLVVAVEEGLPVGIAAQRIFARNRAADRGGVGSGETANDSCPGLCDSRDFDAYA